MSPERKAKGITWLKWLQWLFWIFLSGYFSIIKKGGAVVAERYFFRA